jgi:hypothetical protein
MPFENVDKAVAEKMNISASTVRFQRYNFREKVKQARVILALHELLDEKKQTQEPIPSQDENKAEQLFTSLSPLVLKTFDFKKNKDKKRIFILETIVKLFAKEKKYTECEINAVLKEVYADYATIRRSLITYGLMERTNDGGAYWVK